MNYIFLVLAAILLGKFVAPDSLVENIPESILIAFEFILIATGLLAFAGVFNLMYKNIGQSFLAIALIVLVSFLFAKTDVSGWIKFILAVPVFLYIAMTCIRSIHLQLQMRL